MAKSTNGISISFEQMNKWIKDNNPDKWLGVSFDETRRERFGFSCSSIVESYNSKIIKWRKKQLITMVNEIVKNEQSNQSNSILFNSNNLFMEQIQSDFQEALKKQWSIILKDGHYEVKTGLKVYSCVISPIWCSCGIPTEEKRPCIHLAYVLRGKQSPYSLLPSYYSFQSYYIFHHRVIIKPSLKELKRDRNESVIYEKRKEKNKKRKPSTFKDSFCLKKWKEDKPIINPPLD